MPWEGLADGSRSACETPEVSTPKACGYAADENRVLLGPVTAGGLRSPLVLLTMNVSRNHEWVKDLKAALAFRVHEARFAC